MLIISADIGEGHDLPARAVAREFQRRGSRRHVAIVNGLPAMGSFLTKLLRENSAFMFRWLPWLFDIQYRLFMGFAADPVAGSMRMLTLLGRRGLMRLIRAHNPDRDRVHVPGRDGGARRAAPQRAAEGPVLLVDHRSRRPAFWAHPGIDLHFVTHPETIEEVESIAGPGSVRWAKPPTSPAFLAARSRADARRALGAAGRRAKVIAVSGGGWGVGDLLGATRAALQVPGRDRALPVRPQRQAARARCRSELGGEPRLRVMGFTDRMGDVLAASDALVHSSAGLTVLEAIIRGCPVISYGFGYGHVRVVERRRCSASGSRRWRARSRDIGPALDRALAHRPEPDGSFARRPVDRVADPRRRAPRRDRCRPGGCAPRARSRPRRRRSRSSAGRSPPAPPTAWSRTSCT